VKHRKAVYIFRMRKIESKRKRNSTDILENVLAGYSALYIWKEKEKK